jgi:hypothetical protein
VVLATPTSKYAFGGLFSPFPGHVPKLGYEVYSTSSPPFLPAFPLPMCLMPSLFRPLPTVPRPRSLSFLEEKDEKYESRASRWRHTRTGRNRLNHGRIRDRPGDDVDFSEDDEEEEIELQNTGNDMIKPRALVALRDSFLLQCEHGRLKRPVIHVHFTHPKSFWECCNCVDSDFLFVLVGLTNIFVLQFVVVILVFFVSKEIDLESFDSYYPGFYKGGAGA